MVAHMISYLLATVCVLAFPFLLSGADSQEPGPTRDRQLGDRAFESGLYDVASGYYERMLKSIGTSDEAKLDAYFRLIAAKLRIGRLSEAESIAGEISANLKERLNGHPDESARLSFWKAEIALAKLENAKAIEEYNAAMANSGDDRELRLRALSGLIVADIRLKEWETAERRCVQLATEGGQGSIWEIVSKESLVVVAIMRGDFLRASSIIGETYSGSDKDTRLELLGVYTKAKEGKLSEAKKRYDELRPKAFGPSPFWFVVARSLAGECAERKDYTAALALLEDAYSLASEQSDKQDALAARINVFIASGAMPRAVETCRSFLRDYSGSPLSGEVLVRLIRCLLKMGEYSEAAELAVPLFDLKSLSASDKSAIAKEAGSVLLGLKCYKEAHSYYSCLAAQGCTEADKAEASFNLAEISYAAGGFSEAAATFSALAAKYPALREKSMFKQAKCLYRLKDYKNAISKFQELEAAFPSSILLPEAMYMKARSLRKSGALEEAYNQMRKLASDFPGHKRVPRALLEAGNIAMERKLFADANASFSAAVKADPDGAIAANALYKTVCSNYLANDYEEAQKAVKTLSEKFPASDFAIGARFLLADHLKDIKEYEKAAKELVELAGTFTSKPQVAAKAMADAAYALVLAGKEDEASRLLDKLAVDYPDASAASEGFFLKGDILSERKDYEKAILYYTKAAERRPNSTLELACWGRIGDCHFALGETSKEKIGRFQTAAQFYAKVSSSKIVSKSTLVQALYKIGKCYELMEKLDEAVSKYHEAVYTSLLDGEGQNKKDDISWIAKAGVSLARLLVQRNTPSDAEAAISVYKTLINLGVEPIDDLKKSVNDIYVKFKLKE